MNLCLNRKVSIKLIFIFVVSLILLLLLSPKNSINNLDSSNLYGRTCIVRSKSLSYTITRQIGQLIIVPHVVRILVVFSLVRVHKYGLVKDETL